MDIPGVDQIEILDPFSQTQKVQDIWTALQNESPHSYFNSWGWVGTWLKVVPDSVPVRCVVHLEQGIPKGAFFLTVQSARRARFLKKSCGYLNETGDEEFDDLTIEYNGAVGARSGTTLNLLGRAPAFSGVEEFQFSALSESSYAGIQFPEDLFSIVVTRIPSYYVDLESVRESGTGYLHALSSNRRSQIRRSLKEAQGDGAVELSRATNAAEALGMLDSLKRLHQAEWNKRGKSGAFASEFFNNFHRELVISRFDQGEIELLRIHRGAEDIGYLYNFIYQDEALFYQSGFNFGKSNQSRPGLVCHYLTICDHLDKGLRAYNFLGGKSEYKRSLATSEDTLYGVRVVRHNLKWTIETLLRRLTGKSNGG